MLGAAYGTFSDIEILWVLIALVGLVYSSMNAREAYADRQFIRDHSIINGRSLVANSIYFTELSRAVIQLIFLAVGVIAMTIPEIPPEADVPTNIKIFGFIFRWGLIASSVLLTFKAFLANRVRKALLESK